MGSHLLDKLYHGFSIFAIATLLSVTGFTGFLLGTGKLNGERMKEIGAVLRGGKVAAPTSQPTTQPHAAGDEPAEHGAKTTHAGGRDLESRRANDRLQKASLERANRDVLAQRDLLDQAMQHLISESERFDAQRNAWLEQQKRMRESNADEGFNRELEYFRKMPLSQAKDHLLKVWEKEKADAVRLMAALKPAEGSRIMAEFKSAQELVVIHELLEQLRKQDVDSLVPGSRKTPDAEKP